MIKRNEGAKDRIVRITVGMVFLPVGLCMLRKSRGRLPGLLAAGLGGIGLATGLTGFSVLYGLFGISTLGKEKERMSRCSLMAAGCGEEPSCAGHSCCPDPKPVETTGNQAG